MSSSLNRIYCQNCRAVNPLTNDLCAQCGTRLMLVANSALIRHEDNSATYIHQEHLLERISILENNLTRLAEKSEEALELLLKQARSSYLDHTLLETLVLLLGETGQMDPHYLQREWQRRRFEDREGDAERGRLAAARAKILFEYEGREAARFARQIELAFQSLEKGQAEPALRSFEKAAALDPHGFALHLLIGRLLFGLRKFPLAEAYLERAEGLNPEDPRAGLLYGLTLAERGEAERAAPLLTLFLRGSPASFAAHAALGLLEARVGRWAEALKEFKAARGARPGPEGDLLIGAAYFARGYDRAARRALALALAGAPAEPIAHYLQGLTLLRLREREGAREAFRQAARLAPKKALYRTAARGPLAQLERQAARLNPLAPGPRKLITGSPRLIAEAIIEDALALAAG